MYVCTSHVEMEPNLSISLSVLHLWLSHIMVLLDETTCILKLTVLDSIARHNVAGTVGSCITRMYSTYDCEKREERRPGDYIHFPSCFVSRSLIQWYNVSMDIINTRYCDWSGRNLGTPSTGSKPKVTIYYILYTIYWETGIQYYAGWCCFCWFDHA